MGNNTYASLPLSFPGTPPVVTNKKATFNIEEQRTARPMTHKEAHHLSYGC